MMKRLLIGVALAVSLALGQSGLAHASADSFYISDYKIDYHLSRDGEGQSVLETTETITAQFPDYDQNHGIERTLPLRYDGHATHLKLEGVAIEHSSSVQVSTSKTDDSLTLRIGDPSQYVHGEQTYIIKYSQNNVTKYFADNNADEFYWDTNGVNWRVPISKLSVNLVLDSDLATSLNGNQACYAGQEGSTMTCGIVRREAGGTTAFGATESSLAPGDNVTVAIGFIKGTFVEPALSLRDKIDNLWQKIAPIWGIMTIVSIFLLIPVILVIGYYYNRLSNRKNELKPIPVEYIPPKGVSVSTSGQVLGNNLRMDTAQMMDLAVRHYIRIYQTESSMWVFKSRDYEIEIVKPLDDLLPEEREMLDDMFGRTPEVGDRLALKSLRMDTKFAMRVSDNLEKLNKLSEDTYHYRGNDPRISRKLRMIALVFLILAILTLGIVPGVIAIAVFILSFTIRPLTDEGLVIYRYLRGLKVYIGASEERRFAMLQSPEGVEKTQTDPNDGKAMLKLYERNLPYAILFGQEKEWYKAIGTYYQNIGTSPDYFVGATGVAFSANSFSSAMSGFSAVSSSSSSSSGSGGGGSSGGGGGGGGGGGW